MFARLIGPSLSFAGLGSLTRFGNSSCCAFCFDCVCGMPPKKRKFGFDGPVDLEPRPSELEDIAKLQFTGKAVRAGSRLLCGSAFLGVFWNVLRACI